MSFFKTTYFNMFYNGFNRVCCVGLEQCSLDTGPGTLGISKSLIFHWFYELFLRVGKLWIWNAELSCFENVVISLVSNK